MTGSQSIVPDIDSREYADELIENTSETAHTLLKKGDVPGDGHAVFLAICRRLHKLVGMPRQPEDPPSSNAELQPKAIRRLAATIRIVPRETPVH